MKCLDCFYHFAKLNEEEEKEMKKYYNESYWRVFRNLNNEKITDQKVDDVYLIKKLPKILRDIIEATGIRKSLSYSQYNYLRPHIYGKELLEVGSGEGFVLELFEKKGYHVYGIEPSKDNLMIIKSRIKNGDCQIGFAEDLEKLDKKYDVIIMSHVLEHVVDCEKVLGNLKKLLSPNGVLFIEVPNCENKEALEHSIKTQPHIHHFTRDGLVKLCSRIGFKIVSTNFYYSRIITIGEHIRYFVRWVLKNDCYTKSSQQDGNILRIIVTCQDK
jgi:2-polyprenyl-3-methyl-5-hydroxy-6-metoxy-1,4-benzoquinol methylase